MRTLMLIKPDAVNARSTGKIISMVEGQGFGISKVKVFVFDPPLCRLFYQDHIGKAFYPRLESFMCSGKSWALVLEREDAVSALRQLMGEVEPDKRQPGTIRYLYGHGATDNGVHGSDSAANAEREIGIIFAEDGC